VDLFLVFEFFWFNPLPEQKRIFY